MRRCTAAGAWLVALGVLLGIGLPAGCGRTAPPVLRVGVLVPQAGESAARGVDLLRGAQLAAEQLNAGKYRIEGEAVTVDVIAVDDKSDAEIAKRGARALLERGVQAVIGPLDTLPTAAALPIIAERGVPHFLMATATALGSEGPGNTFRLLAHDEVQGRAIGRFTRDHLQGRRIGVLVEAAEHARSMYAALRAAVPDTVERIVLSFEVAPQGEVSREFALQVQTAAVDVLLVLAGEHLARSLLGALAQVSYSDLTVLGTGALRNSSIARQRVAVRALMSASPELEATEFPGGKVFMTDFSARFKSPPLNTAHYGYDAVMAIADAARRAGSREAEPLIHKLKSIDPMTQVNPQMRFSAEGELVHGAIVVYKAEGGTWTKVLRASAW